MAEQLNLNTEKIEKIKTRVQGINNIATSQADLIAQISEALEGKAAGGGGGSVDTCSIRLICNTEDIYGYTYLGYREGQFIPVYFANGAVDTTLDVTLTDVICGGYIYIQTTIDNGFIAFSIDGEATAEKSPVTMYSAGMAVALVYAPNIAGSNSTVTIIDND